MIYCQAKSDVQYRICFNGQIVYTVWLGVFQQFGVVANPVYWFCFQNRNSSFAVRIGMTCGRIVSFETV